MQLKKETPFAQGRLALAQTASLDQTFNAGRDAASFAPAMLTTGLSQAIIRPGQLILATSLLGDVNFFFLIHMAQEQQQRAGAKDNGQHQRNHSLPLEDAIRAGKRPKFPTGSKQRGQTYN
jgi:hypothetical protein